ncbi:MAG: hypothetical protein EXS31_17790 [Pedosphaera sp.]|nr:hypothetical protein [Pedosphaera sp.]
MRFLMRWLIRLLVLGVILLVALLLLKDVLLKAFTEHTIRTQTGLEVTMARFETGLTQPRLTIEGLRLYNTAEFGGSLLLDVPDLHAECDMAALRGGRFRLKLLRLNLAELNIVEGIDGRTNVFELMGVLQGGSVRPQMGVPMPSNLSFDAIETLNLTVGRVVCTSLRTPAKNFVFDVGLRNMVLTNVKSSDDLMAPIIRTLFQRGISFMGGPSGGITPMPSRHEGAPGGEGLKRVGAATGPGLNTMTNLPAKR